MSDGVWFRYRITKNGEASNWMYGEKTIGVFAPEQLLRKAKQQVEYDLDDAGTEFDSIEIVLELPSIHHLMDCVTQMEMDLQKAKARYERNKSLLDAMRRIEDENKKLGL